MTEIAPTRSITHGDFLVVRMRIVHEADFSKSSPLVTFRQLPEGILNYFTGSPAYVPAEVGLANSQIPYLTLTDPAKGSNLVFTTSKVDFTWQSTTGPVPRDKITVLPDALKILEETHAALGYSIRKMGFVVTAIAYSETPGLVLIEKFCSDKWKPFSSGSQAHFNVGLHDKLTVAGKFESNVWAKFTEGNENPSGKKVVHYESDVNTRIEPGQGGAFTAADGTAFFTDAFRLVAERTKYFWQ